MRRVVAVLVVVLGVSLSSAGPLDTGAADLSSAISARVAALGKPAKGTPEKAEAKQLAKAGKSLAAFQGLLDPSGLSALFKTGKAIGKSATLDSATVQATSALLGCVVDQLAIQEAQLVNDATGMFAPGDQETFRSYLTEARAEIATAALVTTPPDLAFASLRKAGAIYGKAARFVQKVLAAQDSQLLPIMQYPFAVQNRNGVPYTIQSVAFDLVFTPVGGDPVRIQEDFKTHQDPATGFILPYRMADRDSEFQIYPTLYRAIAAVTGPDPRGSIQGVILFKSSKHGKAAIPVDDALSAP